MKSRDSILLATFAILAVLTVAMGTRVARQLERGGSWRAEIGNERSSTLSSATLARLGALEDKVLITYAVSPPERMPSDRKDLERQVVDLLEALRRAAPERFDYLILDPDTDDELVSFASRHRFSPQRVRTVQGDAWSEREVWSSLGISFGARPEAVLHGIGPEHLPRLQDTLIAQLDQMEAPRAARISVAAPPGYAQLHSALAGAGEITSVDLSRAEADGGDPWPLGADLLFWIQPENVGPERLAELERFLERGRSVVIAGGLLKASAEALQTLDGQPALQLETSQASLDSLLSELGLEPVRGLVCDARSDAVVFGGETIPAPFLLRCIAPNQDFSSWSLLPNGTLLFTAPTPLVVDEDRQRARRTTAHTLATSSDATWVQPAPLERPARLAELAPTNGIPLPKQALVVELVPDDPWRGHVLVLAATTPFEDGLLSREGVAHGNLVRSILERFTSDERLVVATSARTDLAEIALQSAGSRTLWRAVVLGLPLAALLAFAVRRLGQRSAVDSPQSKTSSRFAGLAIGLALVLAVLCIGVLANGLRAKMDFTSEGLHGLAPGSRAIAERSGAAGGCAVELLISDRTLLPPELRPRVDRIEETLAAFDRAGAELSVRWKAPEELTGDEYQQLSLEGLRRAQSTDRDEETTTLRSYHFAVRIARGESSELLSFTSPLAFEELEFRLAFALWRLETGRHPRVGFASDVPRPSAAEAYENFQQKGLFAPTGVDVYAAARARLEELDLDLVHINPRAPDVPQDLDALLWFQPRRSIGPMLEAATRFLVGGGNLMVAAQHFRIQARQYRGAGFEGVLWPQPQSPDLENLWLPELGIQLVREVLFDARHSSLPIEAQVVGRGAEQVFERQTMALPFLIRADAAGFDGEHPITRQLGDQALLFASELRWDETRLTELGLRGRSLIESSPQTWSFAWKGGWIPTEFLAGPVPEAEGGSDLLGPVSLAALFEGSFPIPAGHLTLNPPIDPDSGTPLAPLARTDWPAPRDGRLLLLGCSELFTDGRLLDPAFRGDHMLVNSAL
ncbi:MAG: hypothetical protein ACI82F_004065, partial [Planctomycetota bacterium]